MTPHNTTLCNKSQRESAAPLFSHARWEAIIHKLQLSRREHQILEFIFDGHKETSIARELGISHHTVHTHIGRLHKKLDVCDRCELLIRIFETHLALESAAAETAPVVTLALSNKATPAQATPE